MDKKEIRKLVFARRKAASDEQILIGSRAIFDRVRATEDYKKASTVFVYMDYKKEVMTREFIEQCWADGKKVAVPKVHGEIMKFYYIEYFGQLESGYTGILEPITHCPGIVTCADDDEEALFILPGVAFDPQRHRIGYGGGFYDRYQAAHPHHTTMAVAFEFQIMDEVPYEETDICPMYIITESRVID